MVNLKKFVVGPLQANCYLVYDNAQNGFLVDPGFFHKSIISYIKKNNLNIQYLLITHGHFDHVSYAARVKEGTGAKIAMSKQDIPVIEGSYQYGASAFGYKMEKFSPDIFLDDNGVIRVGEMAIRVIATPGHSPGGLCYYLENEKMIFTGDTLFKAAIGRTDLPLSSEEMIWHSLMKRVLTLPDETRVFPGHGPETTIKEEQR